LGRDAFAGARAAMIGYWVRVLPDNESNGTWKARFISRPSTLQPPFCVSAFPVNSCTVSLSASASILSSLSVGCVRPFSQLRIRLSICRPIYRLPRAASGVGTERVPAGKRSTIGWGCCALLHPFLRSVCVIMEGSSSPARRPSAREMPGRCGFAWRRTRTGRSTLLSVLPCELPECVCSFPTTCR